MPPHRVQRRDRGKRHGDSRSNNMIHSLMTLRLWSCATSARRRLTSFQSRHRPRPA
jgi:hypothetical protein